MAQALGPLNRRWSSWMASNAHLLVDDIPRPRYRWRWSAADLSRSQLEQLRRARLIVATEQGRYRTTERCIDSISAYARVSRDEVGCAVGQQVLG